MIKSLIWDSEFFNLKIGLIEIENQANLSELKNGDFDLIYVFSKEIIDLQNISFELTLVDEKIKFLKQIGIQELGPTSQLEVKEFSNDDFDLLSENQKLEFLDLVFLSGHLSRFKIDQNFPENSFERLYMEWINKSLKQENIKVFVVQERTKIVAFATLEIFNDLKLSKIGLIAVDIDYQGLGIGKQLLNAIQSVSMRLNLKSMVVKTQANNIRAMQAYSKFGFNIAKRTYIYHLWNNK